MAGTRSSRRPSTKQTAAPTVASSEMSLTDAAEALSGGDASSLALFFRGLIASEASRGGPQHVCLKRAFALLESRWKVDEADHAVPIRGQGPLAFGESLLSPELFVGVMSFLDPHQAMRSGQACKDWWRNVSTLAAAAHIDLTTLRSRTFTIYRAWGGAERVRGPTDLGWQDLLNHLRHIKKTNPRRVVRRLTFGGREKLGSLSNLSSATAGLLTHIDFSRNHREVDLDQLGANLPGLRGLGLKRPSYSSFSASGSEKWAKSLAKLMSTVSLESLQVCARLEDSSLVAFAGGGDALLRLTLVAGWGSQGADVEEGMAALGAAAPRLQVLTTNQLRVTNKGWEKFGKARLATKRHLVSVRIRAAADAYVPSKTVRALLLKAVTESLLFFGEASALVDCKGRPVAVPEGGGKLRVTSTAPWGSSLLKATDL